MYAESRARAVRIVVVGVIVRAANSNGHIRRVATVRANGLIPKELLFLFDCSSVAQL